VTRRLETTAYLVLHLTARPAATVAGLVLPLLLPLAVAQHHPDAEVTTLLRTALKRAVANLRWARTRAADARADVDGWTRSDLARVAAAVGVTPSATGTPLDGAFDAVATADGGGRHAAGAVAALAALGAALDAAPRAARQAAVAALVTVRMSHGDVLPRAVDEAVQEAVVQRVGDRHVEVQEAAGRALTAVLTSLPHAAQAEVAQRFARHAAVALPAKGAPTAAATLRRRFAGCVGLGAVVDAHPFDVPAFVAPLVVELTRHVRDPHPIDARVRAVLQAFRATHHDEWDDVHARAFTDAQLETLALAQVSGSYFA
jgi:hypothetical protein